MARAVWNGVVLAESDDIVMVEGNLYFPRSSLNNEYFTDSPSRTVCPWKGLASYFDVVVDGRVNSGAAWFYGSPFAGSGRHQGSRCLLEGHRGSGLVRPQSGRSNETSQGRHAGGRGQF